MAGTLSTSAMMSYVTAEPVFSIAILVYNKRLPRGIIYQEGSSLMLGGWYEEHYQLCTTTSLNQEGI
jgi:hypothetical protein